MMLGNIKIILKPNAKLPPPPLPGPTPTQKRRNKYINSFKNIYLLIQNYNYFKEAAIISIIKVSGPLRGRSGQLTKIFFFTSEKTNNLKSFKYIIILEEKQVFLMAK